MVIRGRGWTFGHSRKKRIEKKRDQESPGERNFMESID